MPPHPTPSLSAAGLSRSESAAFCALAGYDSVAATALARDAGMPRATAHLALENLVRKGFASKIRKGATTFYCAEDPDKLVRVAIRKKAVSDAEFDAFRSAAADLRARRPEGPRPRVRMYEGAEGVRAAIFDSLTSRGTVLTLVNADEMARHFGDENARYLAERIRLGVRKKALVTDSPAARAAVAGYDRSVTESRICAAKFRGETNLYDGKVGFVTYRDKMPMGFVIEDADFYETQKSLFSALWEASE